METMKQALPPTLACPGMLFLDLDASGRLFGVLNVVISALYGYMSFFLGYSPPERGRRSHAVVESGKQS